MRRFVPLFLLVLLVGCGSDPAVEETLRAMDAEMSEEQRVAMCNEFVHDPEMVYYSFSWWWRDIFQPGPPDKGRFEEWLERDVCVGISA